MKSFALSLDAIIDLDNLRPIAVEKINFEKITTCPCCENPLKVFARTVGGSVAQRTVGIGHCSTCGYVGYADRPTEAWLTGFYNTEWDTVAKKDIAHLPKFSKSVLLDIAEELSIAKSDSIFDIGAGNGQILKQFREAGYTNLHGTEHSEHRAETASLHAEAKVTHTPFVEKSIQNLKERGPYRFMYSKSVMEHMHTPKELFTTAAALQNEGDYLVVLVPDTDQESVVNVALFMPHLHSYSRQSLAHLAARNGYNVKDVRHHGSGLILIATRASETATPAPAYPFTDLERVVTRWENELEHAKLSDTVTKIYWCNTRDFRRHGVIPSSGALAKPAITLAHMLSVFSVTIRRLLFRILMGIPQRHNIFLMRKVAHSGGDAAIEIHYARKPYLLYK